MNSNWIAGTLELSSKVRYGITSRGVPLFRFIPYDRKLGPFAVGCSSRNLFYNVHAIIQPEQRSPLVPPLRPGELPRGILVQNLGPPTPETEKTVLLTTYAYDQQKELRQMFKEVALPFLNLENRMRPDGFTFHIDPPGCKDVDDAVTICKRDSLWHIWIHIADVAAWVEEGSDVDLLAKRRATSFYSPTGEALVPMLPSILSEKSASLLPSADPEEKPALSLHFTWNEETRTSSNFTFYRTAICCDKSFTYDQASELVDGIPELQLLASLAESNDSHVWVERLMILYNTVAGKLLKDAKGAGLLRRHKGGSAEKIKDLPKELYFLAYDAAEHCLTTEEETNHYGLERDAYAYATSPLRRYADLVNQRVLHALLDEKKTPVTDQELADDLNRREKQAKAFSRDLFFSIALSSSEDQAVEGDVLSFDKEKQTHKVYVPQWKRIIKVKQLLETPFDKGQKVVITWFEDRTKAAWKEKICFSLVSK